MTPAAVEAISESNFPATRPASLAPGSRRRSRALCFGRLRAPRWRMLRFLPFLVAALLAYYLLALASYAVANPRESLAEVVSHSGRALAFRH